jgi:hypothetical protein
MAASGSAASSPAGTRLAECQQHIDLYDFEPYVTQAVELPPPPARAGTGARCPSADIIDSTDDVQ